MASCAAALDVFDIPLEAVIRETKRATAGYVAPGEKDLTKMEDITRIILDAVPEDISYLDSANRLAPELGFEVIGIRNGSKTYVVLRESIPQSASEENILNGAGVYVFRLPWRPEAQSGGRKPVTIVQAPHTRYEAGTQYIACSVFENTDAFALFVNTAHRYAQKREERYVSDLAHNRNTYFHTITKAVCRRFKPALVIQFHGFDASKYRDIDRSVSMILSDGSERLKKGAIFCRIAQRFVDLLGEDAVAIFGVDVFQLGGTTNAQGRYIRRYSNDAFVHVEMTRELRQDFANRKNLRKRFIRVFQ
jgi:hypothetical protein